MKPRISMITLGVKDLRTASEFYEYGLGFPRMDSPPEVAFFTLNGTWLGLFGKDELSKEAKVSMPNGTSGSFALVHNVASESEVNEVIENAVSHGATVTKKAESTSWGGYSGYFQDPEGHLWEIAYNPHFWVGPKDN